MRPIWLMMEIGMAVAGLNSARAACGKKCPKNEGPSSRPAMISPVTPGWLRRRARVWNRRAAPIITISCNSTAASGSSAVGAAWVMLGAISECYAWRAPCYHEVAQNAALF
jgi:hypothetical protein